MGETATNVGIIDTSTVISSVVDEAHCPAFGVKVYVVVPVFAVETAGAHIPEIALVDVVGRTGAVEPWHRVPIGANVGVINELTVIVIVAVEAHCPEVGVNVWLVVPAEAVETAGDHEPLMPFVEVVGRTGAVPPWQIVPTVVNVGASKGLTVILKVVVEAHCPADGVNV